MPNLIDAGFQSSSATENNVPLNITNYAHVDSVDAGTSANVRVYGKAGPGASYPSNKGPVETIRPSATIINAPYKSQLVVALGENYQVTNTLPEVFADSNVPVGAVSVVGSGAVTLPTITPIITAGGIVGYNVTSGGNGLTADVDLTITGSGTGATTGAQVITSGVLISVQPGNPGSGYGGGTTVIASGGVYSGATGGGQSIGGNGGRFVYQDGTQ